MRSRFAIAITAFVIAVLCIAGLAYMGALQPGLDPAQAAPNLAAGDTNLTNLVLSGDLTVGDDLSIADDVTGIDQLTADDITATTGITTADLTTTDDAIIGDDLTVGGFLGLSVATAISVTNGSIITPTGTFQRLTSAGTVTASLSTLPNGTVLLLRNSSTGSIVIVDTGTDKLAGNVTLGQHDTITLISDGTNWNEVSRSNN